MDSFRTFLQTFLHDLIFLLRACILSQLKNCRQYRHFHHLKKKTNTIEWYNKTKAYPHERNETEDHGSESAAIVTKL